MKLTLHPRELQHLRRDSHLTQAVKDVADAIAEDARDRAPRATGRAAESIRADLVDGDDGPEAHVSWDRDHFYLMFSEFGTSRMAPRPFLRPAAQKYE